MATLTVQAGLTVSGISADDIATGLISMTPTVTEGGITSISISDTATPGEKIIESDHYTSGTIVWLKNRSTTETCTIEITSGTDALVLGPGQFALFPWKAATDLLCYSTAAHEDPILEVGVFA
jgi:hypothetical protein